MTTGCALFLKRLKKGVSISLRDASEKGKPMFDGPFTRVASIILLRRTTGGLAVSDVDSEGKPWLDSIHQAGSDARARILHKPLTNE